MMHSDDPEKSIVNSSSWSYPADEKRDLRLDFIRGMVMLILIIIHIDFFSLYNFLVWERIGVVSGGEGFVIVSGLVLGMTYRRKTLRGGWQIAVNPLIDRAVQLYRINLFMIVSVFLISLIPLWDATAITSFIDRASGKIYPLYPATDAPFEHYVAQTLLLKIGPQQFQIMGLYVFLLLFTPVALWLMLQKRTGLLLGACWILYFKNWAFPSMPTGAQFEYAFPLLTWQFTFFHGLAIGFHRKKIAEALEKGVRKKVLLIVAAVLFAGFFFFTQNNPNPAMPDYAKISIIPPDVFYRLYDAYFLKNRLGILRLVNYFAVLVLGYTLLTRYWAFFNHLFGWFFLPIGQNTLYVFIIHVYLVLLFYNIPLFWQGNMWINTVGHTIALLIIWFMVRKKILFRWIPR